MLNYNNLKGLMSCDKPRHYVCIAEVMARVINPLHISPVIPFSPLLQWLERKGGRWTVVPR